MLNFGRRLWMFISPGVAIGFLLLFIGLVVGALLFFNPPLYIPHWSCSIRLEDRAVFLKRGMTVQQVEDRLGYPAKPEGGARGGSQIKLDDRRGRKFAVIFYGGKVTEIDEVRRLRAGEPPSTRDVRRWLGRMNPFRRTRGSRAQAPS